MRNISLLVRMMKLNALASLQQTNANPTSIITGPALLWLDLLKILFRVMKTLSLPILSLMSSRSATTTRLLCTMLSNMVNQSLSSAQDLLNWARAADSGRELPVKVSPETHTRTHTQWKNKPPFRKLHNSEFYYNFKLSFNIFLISPIMYR